MRNLSSIFSAVCAFSSITGIGAATAADLPARTYTKAPAVVVDPSFNWSGFYAGVNGGYAFNDPTVTTYGTEPTAVFFSQSAVPLSFNIAGGFGGIQGGYNWTRSQWLLGLEADFDGSNIKGGATNFNALTGSTLQWTANESVQWFGTLRARVGYLATPNLLLFGTGGFAYGGVRQSDSLINRTGGGYDAGGGTTTEVGCADNAPCYIGSTSKILAGWAAGGGAEYAFARNWSAKVEYLYVNLGNYHVLSYAPNVSAGPSAFVVNYATTAFNSVRAGINYHF